MDKCCSGTALYIQFILIYLISLTHTKQMLTLSDTVLFLYVQQDTTHARITCTTNMQLITEQYHCSGYNTYSELCQFLVLSLFSDFGLSVWRTHLVCVCVCIYRAEAGCQHYYITSKKLCNLHKLNSPWRRTLSAVIFGHVFEEDLSGRGEY